MRRIILSVFAIAALAFIGYGGAQADNVALDNDLLETASTETFQDLTLPPGALAPFCDAGFSGRVFLRGVPFDCYPSSGPNAVCDLSPTDTIVRRLAEAVPPFPATIPIEIVRLELRSVTPFTVTCSGGNQTWDMIVRVPEGDTNQSQGSITINHEFPDGGTFSSTLPVRPTVTFQRVTPSPATVGPTLFPTITFTVPSLTPWCHTGGELDDPVGEYVFSYMEKEPDPPQGPVDGPFFPGIICPTSIGPGGHGPSDPPIKKKVLTPEQAAEAKHGVFAAEKSHHYKCYDINIPGDDPPGTVDLRTQFGLERAVNVGPSRLLCPPALKNNVGDLTQPHLKCYDIIGGDDPAVSVDLTTQFGFEPNVPVGPARRLCVPVLKTVVPQPPPSGNPPAAPHYKCYEILGHDPMATVNLETQFGIETGVDVQIAQFLCAPAMKRREGSTFFEGDLAQDHMKCYQIAGGNNPDPPQSVNLKDQFGSQNNVPVNPARLLCVPAKKVVNTPTLSTWGLLALTVLLLGAATVLLRRQKQRTTV